MRRVLFAAEVVTAPVTSPYSGSYVVVVVTPVSSVDDVFRPWLSKVLAEVTVRPVAPWVMPVGPLTARLVTVVPVGLE